MQGTAPRRRHKRRKYVPGAPPGAIIVPQGAPKPVLRIVAYGPDGYAERSLDSVDGLGAFLGKWPVCWLNVDGLGDAEVIRQIGARFNLHRLALEDVVNAHQRSKVELYEEQLFVVLRMIEPEPPIRTEQLSIFYGKGFVLTFQEHPGDCLELVRARIRNNRGRVRREGPDYLLYCLTDAVLDAYFPHLDRLSERLEHLDDEVLAEPDATTAGEIHEVKRELLFLRREISPLRDAVNLLIRDAGEELSASALLHLRDCYDHAIRIHDMVDTYRELSSGLLDVYLSSVSNRMNEVMRVLTVIATVFIPLTFVVGIYGMNFDIESSPWNMPELYWYWGYPAVLLLMLAIALGQLYVFWRKGWLASFRTPKRRARPPAAHEPQSPGPGPPRR